MNDTSTMGPGSGPLATRRGVGGVRRAVAAAVLCTVAAPWSAQAWTGGEALEIEGPSMRTPVAAAAPDAIATRAEVRDALEVARAWHMLNPGGEIGDTPEVLAQRDAYNHLQAAELHAADQPVAIGQSAAAAQPQWMSLGQLFEMLDQADADGSVVLLVLPDDAASPSSRVGDDVGVDAFAPGVEL